MNPKVEHIQSPGWKGITAVGEGSHQTTCWDCFQGCGILVEIKHATPVKVRADRNHPGSKGYVCIRGVNSLEFQGHPSRLKYPMMRVRRPGQARGEGIWKRASWDEAIDAIVEGFRTTRVTYGPLALCTMVANTLFTRGVAVTLLMRAWGSPNVSINDDI